MIARRPWPLSFSGRSGRQEGVLALVVAGSPLAGPVGVCRWEVERVFTWFSKQAPA